MENIADRLNQKIKTMESPIVVGLDPVLKEIPNCYKYLLEREIKGDLSARRKFNN
ncbi:MAG: hypothetical protein FWF46_01600 [Oscillospiraceae bacterium]|nr:hypothetical protein [Oscillospiraceae bacterium]